MLETPSKSEWRPSDIMPSEPVRYPQAIFATATASLRTRVTMSTLLTAGVYSSGATAWACP